MHGTDILKIGPVVLKKMLADNAHCTTDDDGRFFKE